MQGPHCPLGPDSPDSKGKECVEGPTEQDACGSGRPPVNAEQYFCCSAVSQGCCV